MIKKKFLKLISLILGFILTSCDSSPIINNKDDPGSGTAEYGTPSAVYKISGHVKDTQDNPIEGIQISFQHISVLTDNEGEWNIDSTTFPCWDDECELLVEDIDGPDNGGEFQDKTVDLNLQQTEDGSGWNDGTFEEHSIEIVVEEVVDEP